MTAEQAEVVESVYTPPQVCQLAGITYRQLDHWCRCGYLRDDAAGSGSRRTFTSDELDTLHAVAALANAGIGVREAFTIARQLVTDGQFSLRVGDIYQLTVTVLVPDSTETQEDQ